MKWHHKFSKISCVALVCLGLAACGGENAGAPIQTSTINQSPTPAASPEKVEENTDENFGPELSEEEAAQTDLNSKINIAVMLPLSGPNADIGNAMLKAVTLALFDSYDPRIKIFPLDTGGTEAGTLNAARLAVDAKVRLVIGPLLASNVTAAGDALNDHNIPLIGLSNDRTVAMRGRYIMGFLPENEVSRVLSYSFKQGNTRMAALIPNSQYGYRILDSFGETLSYLGADVQGIETYPLDPDNVQDSVKNISDYDRRFRSFRNEVNYLRSLRRDMSDELARRLERAEKIDPPSFDTILLPEGGDLLRTMSPLLPFYEVDPKKVRFLGTGLMNDSALFNEPSLQGSWFAGVSPEKTNKFIAHYQNTYGEEPPLLASIAYDAMSLAAILVRDTLKNNTLSTISESEDPIFTIDRIENKQGFMGINGLFRFLPDGTNERAFSILEINRRGLKVIDPAPAEFPSFGYSIKQVADKKSQNEQDLISNNGGQ